MVALSADRTPGSKMGRSLRLTLLGAWLGAILLFAIAVAPNAFAVLTPHEGGRALAGDIVNRALAALHYFGLACGLLFLLLGVRRSVTLPNVVVAVMLLLTCISQFGISRRMHAIRGEASFESLTEADSRRVEFDRLHKASTTAEGAILVLGVIALIAESRRKTGGR